MGIEDEFYRLQEVKDELLEFLKTRGVSLMPNMSPLGDFHYTLISNETGRSTHFGTGSYFKTAEVWGEEGSTFVDNETKIVIVYCGCYRRALLHPSDHEHTNNECQFESRVKVDLVDWEEKQVSMKCPSCHNMLHQTDNFIEDDGRKFIDDTVIDLTFREDNASPSKIKTVQEIRNEIEATKRTMENYRTAYKQHKITKADLKSQLIDCESTKAALSWVLGENDRFD